MSDYEGRSDRGALEFEIGVEGRLRTHVAQRHHGPGPITLLKHILGRALESQRTKGDCREAIKTKGKFHFSAAHSNLTMLQTNTNASQVVQSIACCFK
jgi:hypothetical protein